MGLPRKLINLNAYIDGEGYLGRIAEFEQPKLAIATEDWRGGGMIAPVKLDKGLEGLEATLTFGGHEMSLNRFFGNTAVDAVPIRLISAYRADNYTPAQAVEIFMLGRFTEIDEGKSKPGDDTEHKYTVALTYYRRTVDGTEEILVDALNGHFRVNGVDRYAEIMDILLN